MSNKRVYARSWNRFLSPSLAVAPALMGARHDFVVGTDPITVALPSKYDETENKSFDGGPEISAWRVVGGVKTPTRIEIPYVDVLVDVPGELALPDIVLSRAPNAYDVLDEAKQAELEACVDRSRPVAEKAFDIWLRVLRWKTDEGALGRPRVVGPASGWSTYLTERHTGHRFWAGTMRFSVSGGRPLTLEQWNNVQSTLQAGEFSPVYVDLVFDAADHLAHGDLSRAVIDTATACETYLRERVGAALPSTLGRTFVKHIEGVNARRLIDDFFVGAIGEAEKARFRALQPKLRKLFEARNHVLHRGTRSHLTVESCESWLVAARKLILQT